MKEIQYRTFSLKTHKKNWRAANPNICQFEVTFQCGLHCRHCYTNCYNNSEYIKKELVFKDIKLKNSCFADSSVSNAPLITEVVINPFFLIPRVSLHE